MEPILVITTCEEKKDAGMIAQKILERKLGACVQIYSGVQSCYWWKGEIVQESESVVWIKSCKTKYTQLEQLLFDIHPYEVPEIISIEIDKVSPAYLTWLKEELGLKINDGK